MKNVRMTRAPAGFDKAATRASVPGENAARAVLLERRSIRKVQANSWDETVAMAAPATPQPAPKMRAGARIKLMALEARVAKRVVRVS
jgi:hypothetical protein